MVFFFSRVLKPDLWLWVFSVKLTKLWKMGYAKKKFKQKDLRELVEDILWFVTLPMPHTCKFCRLMQNPLEVARPKTKTHGNSKWFFLDYLLKFYPLGNFISFLIDPWNFHLLTLFSIPLEIPCPKPPVWIFSWINRIYLFWTHLTSKLGNAEGLEMSHCPTNNNALTFKDSTKFRSWKNTWETQEALPTIRPNANGLLLPLRSKTRS